MSDAHLLKMRKEHGFYIHAQNVDENKSKTKIT